jgi:hypothetical protein
MTGICQNLALPAGKISRTPSRRTFRSSNLPANFPVIDLETTKALGLTLPENFFGARRREHRMSNSLD